MKEKFDTVSFQCSKATTNHYSTSFSLGTSLLGKAIRKHIYSIYGFVRFADEIVDSFHGHDKNFLLKKFTEDTFEAIERGISLNPILNSFQHTVNTYQIGPDLIVSFLKSMEMDLEQRQYDEESFEEYIYGSAEVVGLMCLKVFVEGDVAAYEKFREPALALGAAFQKVNFLRDLKYDSMSLGRTYFPQIQIEQFDECTKKIIEKDIENDFSKAFEGIRQLPESSKFGVYVAYIYYFQLFKTIKKKKPVEIMNARIRVPNAQKIYLLTKSYFKMRLSLV